MLRRMGYDFGHLWVEDKNKCSVMDSADELLAKLNKGSFMCVVGPPASDKTLTMLQVSTADYYVLHVQQRQGIKTIWEHGQISDESVCWLRCFQAVNLYQDGPIDLNFKQHWCVFLVAGRLCTFLPLNLMPLNLFSFWMPCLLQTFRQESSNDRAFFLVGCAKKLCAARFWNAASNAKIWKPDISSVQETAFSGILLEFFGIFIVAKTRRLELATNNLLTRSHS